MRVIKIKDVAGVAYQFRHWGRWYWTLEDGQIVNINKAIKTAKVVDNE